MPFIADNRIAEQFEDLASQLDAGLVPDAVDGSSRVAALRSRFPLAGWECATLAAGERSGTLPGVLRRIAQGHRERALRRREILGALAYPLLVLTMCAFIGALLLATGAAPTAWVVTTATLALLVLLAGGAVAWRLRDPTLDGDRLPVLGRLTRCAAEVPYLVALRALYGAGVGLRTAHEEATPAARVPWVRTRLHLATRDLEAGESLAAALSRHGALTEETSTLLRNGEAAGQLEDALERAATRRQEEYARATRRAARAIGVLAYAYAAASVLWIALRFYGSYYGRL